MYAISLIKLLLFTKIITFFTYNYTIHETNIESKIELSHYLRLSFKIVQKAGEVFDRNSKTKCLTAYIIL